MLNLIIHNQSEDQKKAVDVIASENIRILEEAKAGETCYADSQGWIDTEEWAGEENIKRLEEIAKEIRENADAFVLIGVGGSNNAARSVIEALKKDDAPEIIYAGNTLSPYALNQMLKRLKGKSVYIDCIAKNFETLEPGSSFRILREYMESEYGKEESAKRTIAVGTTGSSLEKLCEKYGYTFLEFPLNVGGRYTAMTNVGLLPMAVAGIDIRELVKGARDMQIRVHEESTEKNIYELAGETFNIGSPKQVGEVLFDKLKIVEKAKKTKTGQYVTSEEVLESLRGKHAVIGKILEYRGLKKLLSTYIDALPQLINSLMRWV